MKHNRFSYSALHWIALVLLLTVFCAAMISTALADTEAKLSIDISFDENLMFSQYDVEMYIDNTYITTIPHGKPYSGTVNASNGTHVMAFYRTGKHSIYGSTQFTVDGDTTFQCRIHAYNDQVSVSGVMTVCAGSQVQTTPAPTSIPETKSNNTSITKVVKYIDPAKPFVTEEGIQLTITSIRQSNGSDVSSPARGNVFVLVSFDVENNTSSAISLSAAENFEVFEDGYVTEYSYDAELEATGRLSNIPAGRKGRGEIGFEVSSGWQELEVHYIPNANGAEEYVFVIDINDL